MSKCDECLITTLKERIEHLETTVFAIVWNNGVAPVGMRLGKSEAEIADMTLETIDEIEKMIIYYPKMRERLQGAKERKKAKEGTEDAGGKYL